MPASTPRHARTAAPTETAETPVETPVEVPVAETSAEAPGCNVPGCTTPAEHRGLCPAHRQTHRGLLGPKEDPSV